QIKDGPCRIYMSDIRVNFDLRNDEYYYYPDIVVTCDKRDTHKRFVHYPKLIIEVLSGSTERVDKREKLFAYTSIVFVVICPYFAGGEGSHRVSSRPTLESRDSVGRRGHGRAAIAPREAFALGHLRASVSLQGSVSYRHGAGTGNFRLVASRQCQ